MSVSVDAVAASLADSFFQLCTTVPGGWAHREASLVAGVTGLPIPTLNSVVAVSTDPPVDIVADLLDRVAASGVPHSLQVRPGTDPVVVELAVDRGLVRQDPVPLMVLDGPGALTAPNDVGDLEIRRLGRGEGMIHAEVAATGMEAPVELFATMMTGAVLDGGRLAAYVGEVDGVPVTTGMGVRLGELLSVVNVATLPGYRGRGAGTAVTRRIAVDGMAAGAAAVWLQSSPAGYGIYERLGFETAEWWECWVTPD